MKRSAGILVYRSLEHLEVLLVHPGGPFYKSKDLGVWSIPKGEFSDDDPLEVAQREFFEETGNRLNILNLEKFIRLEDATLKSGKRISAWAVECDFPEPFISSNTFEIEWPPRSAKTQTFPEVDKAEWFSIPLAREKIHPGQIDFINQLERLFPSTS